MKYVCDVCGWEYDCLLYTSQHALGSVSSYETRLGLWERGKLTGKPKLVCKNHAMPVFYRCLLYTSEMSAPVVFPPAVRWRWALQRTTTRSPSRCRSRGTSSPYPPVKCRGTMRKRRGCRRSMNGTFPSTMPLWLSLIHI